MCRKQIYLLFFVWLVDRFEIIYHISFRRVTKRFFIARRNDINFDYNSEIKKCKTIDDILGKNGLVQRLVRDVLENILEVEMDEYLGRDKYQRRSDIESGEKNYRNGYS